MRLTFHKEATYLDFDEVVIVSSLLGKFFKIVSVNICYTEHFIPSCYDYNFNFDVPQGHENIVEEVRKEMSKDDPIVTEMKKRGIAFEISD